MRLDEFTTGQLRKKESTKKFSDLEIAIMEGGHSLDKPTQSLANLSKKHNVSYKALLGQLQKGIKVELEHTSDAAVAKEIALDHLKELPDYYDRLESIEAPSGLSSNEEKILNDMLLDFVPLAMKELKLKKLPPIKFQKIISPDEQPSFGRYKNESDIIFIGVNNRHPVDILRTLAHELAHHKQDIEHKLDNQSGKTGSRDENEAHAQAGVIMRHFNKLHPNYFDSQEIDITK